jgi:hypothetical protein
MTDLLADAVARLYEADPDEFMPLRKDLAEAARAAGDKDAAKKITGLRKPTRSAWVVNRLVRSDPEVTGRLAALASELRGAEQSRQGSRIRELSAARARLVDELTRQALAGLTAPPAAVREEVTATLDAALSDPEVAASLGTLVRAAHWAGFGLAPLADGEAAPAPEPAPARRPEPAEAVATHERRRQERIISAERDVAEAVEAAQAAAVAEQRLEDTVRQLEAELAQARQDLGEARRQSYRAESRQRRAELTLGRLRE